MTELLYMTSVDVSQPNGPGVNELQFILAAAQEYGDDAHFVIPGPMRPLPDIFPLQQVTMLPKLQRRSPISWLRHFRTKMQVGCRLLEQLDPSYVVFRISILPVVELQIAKSARAAFIKTAGSGQFAYLKKSPLWQFILPLQRAIYARVLLTVRGADVVSKIHCESLESFYPAVRGRVQVFDNAVDTSIFRSIDRFEARKKLGLDKYRYLVGYIGNLADIRGGQELLDCWPYIEHCEHVGLVIISGDQVGIERLRAKATKLGILDRLTTLGPMSMIEIPIYMGLLDIGVSFRDDDGCSELKVRQYLSCGVPVVASAKVNSFIEDAGLGRLVSRDNPVVIGKAISDILQGRSCVCRDAIRDYALVHLGFSATLKQRRSFWRERAKSAV